MDGEQVLSLAAVVSCCGGERVPTETGAPPTKGNPKSPNTTNGAPPLLFLLVAAPTNNTHLENTTGFASRNTHGGGGALCGYVICRKPQAAPLGTT